MHSTDFHNFFSPSDRYLFVDDRSGPIFSDCSRDVAMATNFGRNWQNDHSADWRSETDRNMPVPIQKYLRHVAIVTNIFEWPFPDVEIDPLHSLLWRFKSECNIPL